MRYLLPLLVLLLAGTATAKQVKYAGAHPIVEGHGEGFCYLEFPHVHVYAPPTVEVEVAYRPHGDDGLVFVGDPTVVKGYEGTTTAYFGPHPIPVSVVVAAAPDVCFIEGPHSHAYTPPAGPTFVARENVFYFTGELPVVEVEARPRFVKVNEYYKRHRHQKHWKRPDVVGPPPAEYHVPAFVVAEPAVVVPAVGVAAGVGVAGPGIRAGIEVSVPLPTVVVRPPALVVHPAPGKHDDDDDDEHRLKLKKPGHKKKGH